MSEPFTAEVADIGRAIFRVVPKSRDFIMVLGPSDPEARERTHIFSTIEDRAELLKILEAAADMIQRNAYTDAPRPEIDKL